MDQMLSKYTLIIFILFQCFVTKAQLPALAIKEVVFTKDTMDSGGKMLRIDGKIANHKNEPVEYAHITLKNFEHLFLETTESDSVGHFTFFFLPELEGDTMITLDAEYIGFENASLKELPVVITRPPIKVYYPTVFSYPSNCTYYWYWWEHAVIGPRTVNWEGYQLLPYKEIRDVVDYLGGGPIR